MVPPSGVKLGSSPPSEVIWVKPPPVIGMMAMPVPLTKTMVWPLAETSGRSSAMLPHVANGQSTLATPVLGSRVWRSLVTLLTQTIGPLVPGNAACADGAAATKAKPAMVPVARSVPKRPRHLLLSADTRSTPFWVRTGLVLLTVTQALPPPSRRPTDNRPLRGDVGRDEA